MDYIVVIPDDAMRAQVIGASEAIVALVTGSAEAAVYMARNVVDNLQKLGIIDGNFRDDEADEAPAPRLSVDDFNFVAAVAKLYTLSEVSF